MAKYKLNSVTYDLQPAAYRITIRMRRIPYVGRAGRTPGVIRLDLFPVYVIENFVTEIIVVYFRIENNVFSSNKVRRNSQTFNSAQCCGPFPTRRTAADHSHNR